MSQPPSDVAIVDPQAARSAESGERYYKTYIEAEWGLKNHWFPALFSKELAEGEMKGVRISGVPLLLCRSRGKVYAVKDECVHRGVKMSARPTCFKEGTVTCWYHGYTYDLTDGRLVTIVAAPKDPLIGRVKVRTFPVEEVNGIIFAFVGDEGYAPLPPLGNDLPLRLPDDYMHRAPHPLDSDAVILGIRREVKANWRLAAENGADPGHVLIHRDNQIVFALDMAFPLGELPLDAEAFRVFEGEGPKGIMNMIGSEHMMLVTENEELGLRMEGNNQLPGLRTSMWVPGVLMVENWPKYGLAQYEWYVPVDDKTHTYWQVLARRCATDKERRDFQREYENLWEKMALRDFNDNDAFAREQMQPFYENGKGWYEERLCGFDAFIVDWRKLIVKYARGIQDAQR